MIRLFIEGIGVLGPGLEGWREAQPVLAGEAPYTPRPLQSKPSALLPPAERRRAGATVGLALATGTEALGQAGRDAAEMATVFAASGGDGETVHEILTVLASEQRNVSPTRFHNSVHNAPSGYWSVATGSRAPSTSLCAFDDSFAAGLLEAAAQVCVQDYPVTLIAYDVPYPQPLHAARPIVSAFGAALVLVPSRTERTLAALELVIADTVAADTAMPEPELERLRLGNPAARALPVLAALARGAVGTIRLGEIVITVSPP
jgi:hypothetical protein